MSSIKEDLRRMIDHLPDDCGYDDIQFRVFVMARLQQAKDDLRTGNVSTQDEIERKVKRWLKSHGLPQPKKTSSKSSKSTRSVPSAARKR